MKNYLFIVYEMIPYTKYWGAAQRVYFFANFLKDQENKVHIISSKNTSNEFKYNRDIKFDILHFNNQAQVSINEAPNLVLTGSRQDFLGLLKLMIKKITRNILLTIEKFFINEPNCGVGIITLVWLYKHRQKIIKYVYDNSIDFIIVSAPPFSLFNFFFLRSLKKKTKAKIILDYRDPWNCWNGQKGPSKLFERKALNLSDFVITTNEKHKQKIIEDFKYPITKIKVIMNGYDLNTWNSISSYMPVRKSNKIVISYIGSISFDSGSYRNPDIFLNALKKYPVNDLFEINFIGVTLSKEKLNEISQKFKFANFYGIVTHKRSLELMLDSDVLLNLHTSNDDSSKYLIGGKLFDYYKSNRFVLSINSKDSFEASFIKKENIGLCVENNIEEILESLNYIVSNKNIIKSNHHFRSGDEYSRLYFCKELSFL